MMQKRNGKRNGNRTRNGTAKGTPFLTAKKRNEAGTTASISTKERGRNVFLKNEER